MIIQVPVVVYRNGIRLVIGTADLEETDDGIAMQVKITDPDMAKKIAPAAPGNYSLQFDFKQKEVKLEPVGARAKGKLNSSRCYRCFTRTCTMKPALRESVDGCECCQSGHSITRS